MVPLSVTLTIGCSTWHWISHLRRMNTTTHSYIRTKIMRALFSPLFKRYKGKLMTLCKTRLWETGACSWLRWICLYNNWVLNEQIYSLFLYSVCINNTHIWVCCTSLLYCHALLNLNKHISKQNFTLINWLWYAILNFIKDTVNIAKTDICSCHVFSVCVSALFKYWHLVDTWLQLLRWRHRNCT